MATAPTPATPASPPYKAPEKNKVTVISHSNIFYWWPVWLIGLVLGAWTLWVDRSIMATMPAGTEAIRDAKVEAKVGDKTFSMPKRDVLVLPEDKHLPPAAKGSKEPAQPRVHMARNKNLGVLFSITLLLVLTITNIPLRGMWSVVVIITVIMLSIIFWLAGWWETIVTQFHYLDIRINAGGYFLISLFLLGVWLVALLFFDRQTYMVFEPGVFRVCTEIGGGEKVFDTRGLKLEKARGDLFRHYILGLGSGDLVVKTTGATSEHFDLPNVLFIRQKMRDIERIVHSMRTDKS